MEPVRAAVSAAAVIRLLSMISDDTGFANCALISPLVHVGLDRVDVELTTDQKLHSKSSLPSCFSLSWFPVGGRKLSKEKAKSEPISNLEDMVRI